MKIWKCWKKKLKNTPENRKPSYAYVFVGFVLWKYPFYQKQSTDSMQYQSKLQPNSSYKLKKILKFVCKHKRPIITKTLLNNKNIAEAIIIFDFKLLKDNIVYKTI